MKKIFILLIFILLSLVELFSQWSTDPNNNLIVGYGLDPHICSDSAGGCYITYDYENIYYPRKLAIERIDKYGYKPWGAKKQILGELPEQWQAEITEDGQGGVIVSYIDRYVNLPSWFERVRVQRIDSSGNFLWGPTGVRVTLEEINHSLQAVISDGSGGCVVAWQDVNDTCYVNRISSNGERLWGDSGKVLGISSYSGTKPIVIRASDGNHYVQVYPDIFRINQNGEILNQYSTTFGLSVADPEGGIILTGSANWSINGFTLVSQRKDSLGNNLWQEPYVEIADSLDINTILNIKDNNGYFYYSWTGKKNGIDKVSQLQALRLDGTKLFPNGSLTIGEPPRGGGAAIITLERNKTALIYGNSGSPDSLLVQAIDTLGNKLWNTNGVLISYPTMGSQSYTTDGNNGFIIGGTKNQFTIVVQQVSKDGILGQVVIPVELISLTASISNDKVELNWRTATETNNSGFEIQRKQVFNHQSSVSKQEWISIGFVNGNGTTTEPKSYSFVDKDITTGTYKYRLKQIDYDGTYKYSDEIEVEINNTPTEFVLYQNYPNPFNSSTIIKYQIPEEGWVRINLYNILGEKLLTLFEGEQKSGEYQVSLSSDELPSGNYFYSLESGSFRSVKKLTIIK